MIFNKISEVSHGVLVLLFVLCFGINLNGQISSPPIEGKKGQFYLYWGYNRAAYTTSNIRFEGENYNFELAKVKASDRQTKFDFDTYLNPTKLTIPQNNFRLGYFFHDNYNISFGFDHMKYVVNQEQVVNISGYISKTNTQFDRDYADEAILIDRNFLQLEHTDGLNYINIEIRRFDKLFSLGSIHFHATEGLGVGALYPRTNATLLRNERNDEFHVSGYGLSGVLGLNIQFFKGIFIQSEFKSGFINMPDIRTTASASDRASQHFFFGQVNVVLGGFFRL